MKGMLLMPPCVRQQIFQYVQPVALNTNAVVTARRALSNGSRLLKQKHSLPVKTAPPARTQQLPINIFRDAPSYAETLLQGSDKVLLYASPKHTGLFASSYLIGGAFLFGAYSWAQFALKEGPNKDGQPSDQVKQPWYIKTALTAEILTVVALGTHFILAPSKLVKSITLVKVAASNASATSGPLSLRLEIKRAVPFLRPDVLETAPSQIFLDRSVKSSEDSLRFASVPRAEAQQFTSHYFAGGSVTPADSGRHGVAGALRSIWPSIRLETRRMFLRDQMAYLRTTNNGRFKLDLQGAALLDGARPLSRLISRDHEKRIGIFGFIKSVVST